MYITIYITCLHVSCKLQFALLFVQATAMEGDTAAAAWVPAGTWAVASDREWEATRTTRRSSRGTCGIRHYRHWVLPEAGEAVLVLPVTPPVDSLQRLH